jgi:hypothetical protein
MILRPSIHGGLTTRGETFVLRRHHNPTVTASKCDFSWARADINRFRSLSGQLRCDLRDFKTMS